jgi:hypothetical protein
MKALKVIGIILFVLGAAVLVFYLGWLSPPSGDAVCDNLAAVAKKETNFTMPATALAECKKQVSTPPQYGRLPWVKQLKCLRDAKSKAEITACGGSPF